MANKCYSLWAWGCSLALILGVASACRQNHTEHSTLQLQFKQGVQYHTKGQLDSALLLYNTLLPKATALGDSLLAAQIENNLSALWRSRGNLTEANAHIGKALHLYRALNDSSQLAGSLVNQAQLLKNLNQQTEALALLYEATPILQQTGQYKALFSASQTIGNIERAQLNFNSAFTWHRRALALAMQHRPKRIASAYNNLGKDFQAVGQYDSAHWAFGMAYTIKDSLQLTAQLPSTLLNIALLLDLQGQPQPALDTLNQALAISNKAPNSPVPVKLLTEKARILAGGQQWQAANSILKRITQLPHAGGPSAQQRLDVLLAQQAILVAQGQYQQANALMYPIMAAKDSVMTQRRQQDMNRLTANFQLSQLANTNRIQALTINQQLLRQRYLAMLLVLLALVAGLAALLYTRANKARQLKTRLLHDLNHRIKNNLVIIESMLRLEMQQSKTDETKDVLVKSSNRLMAISAIHSKLQTNRLETLGTVNAPAFIQQLCHDTVFACGLEERVVPDVHVQPAHIDMDKAIKIGQLLSETITNACKYAFNNHQQPQLTISLTKQNGSCTRSNS